MSHIKAFFEKHRPDGLTEAVLRGEIKTLEAKADKIEHTHYDSQPHLDAAKLLRVDVDGLKSVMSRVVAGQSAIPPFQKTERYRDGAVVLHAGAIWQKTGKAEAFQSEPGRSDDWTVIAGTPAPRPSPLPAVMDINLDGSKHMPTKTPQDRAEVKHWKAIEKDVQEAIEDAGFSEASLRKPISLRFMLVARTALARMFKEALDNRDETINQLKSRIDALEAGGISYKGVWQRAQTYRKGSMVTEGGSAWIALRATSEGEKPGPSDAWQLAVKAGRDGSGAR